MGDKNQEKIIKHHAQVTGARARRKERQRLSTESRQAWGNALRLQYDYFRMAWNGYVLAFLMAKAVMVIAILVYVYG